jgi:hypothetical protein
MAKMKHQRIARRSGVAIAAQHRNSGGPMRHRLQPKGGARNRQVDITDEWADEDAVDHDRDIDVDPEFELGW